VTAGDAGWAPLDAATGVRAWGATRASAFAQAAQGVLALIVKPEDVAEREHREVRAQGQSPELLLFNWITECLYVHEIEGFVVRRVEVDACSATVVHGVLHGEELDTGRHRLSTSVKAATMDHLSVIERDGRHELRIGVKA
jgi:SHS2 domain-containing protein